MRCLSDQRQMAADQRQIKGAHLPLGAPYSLRLLDDQRQMRQMKMIKEDI